MMGQVSLSFHVCNTSICINNHFMLHISFLFVYLFICYIYVFCESTVAHNSLDEYTFHTLWCMFLHTALAAFHASVNLSMNYLEVCGITVSTTLIVRYFMSAVPFRNRERITFDHLVSMKKPGETAVLKVLRDGKEQELSVILRPVSPCHILLHLIFICTFNYKGAILWLLAGYQI